VQRDGDGDGETETRVLQRGQEGREASGKLWMPIASAVNSPMRMSL